MSLDVYLELEHPVSTNPEPEIYIRADGANRKATRAEWNTLYPEREPITVTPDAEERTVYEANITHNLGGMASEAEIYEALWRPEEIGIEKAGQLIGPLSAGINRLNMHREHFEQFNPPNGWGTYDYLVQFTKDYLAACIQYPEAVVRVSR